MKPKTQLAFKKYVELLKTSKFVFVRKQGGEKVRSRGGDADGETMSVEILQLKSGDFRCSR